MIGNSVEFFGSPSNHMMRPRGTDTIITCSGHNAAGVNNVVTSIYLSARMISQSNFKLLIKRWTPKLGTSVVICPSACQLSDRKHIWSVRNSRTGSLQKFFFGRTELTEK